MPPPRTAIVYRDDVVLDAAQFKDILNRSGLAARRPVDDPARLARMLSAYTLVLTAWEGDLLVGVSTLWTDYAFTAYLADLAVDLRLQKQGIGKELIRRSCEAVGPQVTLLLLAAPAAAGYYPKIGMERFNDCFIRRRSQ